MRRFGEPHHRRRRHRLLVAKATPVVTLLGGTIVEFGLVAIADEEQIAEKLHRGALLAFAEQRGDRHAEKLPEQIEQRGFDRGERVNHDAQVKGLKAAAAAVAVGKGLPYHVEHRVIGADRLADDQRPRVVQRLTNALAARHLAGAGAAGAVFQDDDVAREERTVRAAEIEQHAVFAGDRDDQHFGHDGRAAAGFRWVRQWMSPRDWRRD